MDYLSTLNPPQLEAVLHTDGPLLVFAGAGSGKTRVLTYRVAHLIKNGVDPYNIIAITFTNKAAAEMRERICSITPLGQEVWVSTFHAACMRILRREIDALGYRSGFTVYDTQDSERLIKECIKELKLNDKDYPPRMLATAISTQKNELVSPVEYERASAGYFRETIISDVYTLYQKKLQLSNALDFDDIIFKTVTLLTHHDDVRNKYQRRFQYVLVDEYQDTNHAQYRLVNLLVGESKNICVVGDDDQSIYGWRGANIENILRFENDYPNPKIVKLEENYRSTQTILDAANAVISLNETRAQKSLFTQNDKGANVKLYTAATDKEEGAFVANTIKKRVDKGAKYSDFAVLYRTNAQSRIIEDSLVMQGLPYKLYGGVRFYERMEVKDVLAYLKAIYNPSDDLAYTRIINVPRRGIGATTITKIQAYAAQKSITFSQALSESELIPGIKNKNLKKFSDFMADYIEFASESSVPELLAAVLEHTGYYDGLTDGTPEGESRKENVDELKSKATQFDRESDDKSLGRFLEDVALVADIDSYLENSGSVSLMTLHSAKGLEFNTVFIVGLEEYIFPSSRAVQSTTNTALEEERRLCYVGFTRAEETLYVSHALRRLKFDGFASNPPSRFLAEIPIQCIEMTTLFGDTLIASARAYGQTGNKVADQNKRALPLATANPTSENPGKAFIRPTKTLLPQIDKPPDYTQGDIVVQPMYGKGKVIAIVEKKLDGITYDVIVKFDNQPKERKFVARYSKIEKYDEAKHLEKYGPVDDFPDE